MAFFPAEALDDSEFIAADRYRALLEARPERGIVLDRLWDLHSEDTEALLEIYRARTKDPTAVLLLGLLEEKAGRSDAAVSAFAKAAELAPKDPRPHAALGGLESQRGKFSAAAKAWQHAADLVSPTDPRSTKWLLACGSALLSSGDTGGAVALFEALLADRPGDEELRRGLVETYLRHDLPDRARPLLEALAATGEPEQRAQDLRQLGDLQDRLGAFDAASRALEEALRITAPGNWLRDGIQSDLIRLYDREDRAPELLEKWRTEADHNPRDAEPALRVADLLAETGEPPDQLVWLRKAADLSPSNAALTRRLAELEFSLNDIPAARARFEALTKKPNERTEAAFALARIDLHEGNSTAARFRLEALLEGNDDTALADRMTRFFIDHRIMDGAEHRLRLAAENADPEDVLALAKFLITDQRASEGVKALEKLLRPSDPPDRRADAALRAGNLLMDEGRPQEARRYLDEALRLAPDRADLLRTSGEIEFSLGNLEVSAELFQRAFDAESASGAKQEIDRRLFQTLAAIPANPLEKPKPPAAPAPGLQELLAPRPTVELTNTAPGRTAAFYLRLVETAGNDPEAHLRAARWARWLRNNEAALARALEARNLAPDSPRVLEFLADLARETGNADSARQLLQRLSEIDPARRSTHLIRLGRLLLETGDTTAAIATFASLNRETPGNPAFLRELALAQQKAGQWSDALGTWRNALRHSPPANQREFLDPLLRVLERLGLHSEAADALWQAVEKLPDGRDALLKDLIAYCSKHGLSEWIEAQCRSRLKRDPNDYFLQKSLAAVLRASGREEEAVATMARARHAAPDQAEPLQALVRDCGDAGDLDRAIGYQRRLLRLDPFPPAQDLAILAGLQDENLDIAGAGQTWDRLAKLHPRDAEHLARAAEHFAHYGRPDRAAELFRAALEINPRLTDVRLTLGELLLAGGDAKNGRAEMERILLETRPESGSVRYPPIDRTENPGVLLRGGRGRAVRGPDTAPPPPGLPRLRAIRALALLAGKDSDSKEQWARRWAAVPSDSEALWALFFADCGEAFCARFTDLLRRRPGDSEAVRHFVPLALALGQASVLAQWCAEEAPRREILVQGLEQFLSARVRPLSADEVNALFPPEFRSRSLLWKASVLFGSHGDVKAAAQLARRVFEESSSQKAVFGTELARWEILACKPQEAVRVLAESLHGSADGFGAPYYDALREYYLLLPDPDRPAFFARVEKETASPLHRACALSLLQALDGQRAKARAGIEKLVTLRGVAAGQDLFEDFAGPADARHWTFLLNSGVRLETWGLEWLALHLWRTALGNDALLRLQGEQVSGIAAEIRLRCMAMEIASEASARALDRIASPEVAALPPETQLALAAHFERLGDLTSTAATLRLLWNRDPSNTGLLRSILQVGARTGEPALPPEQVTEFLCGDTLPDDDESRAMLMRLFFEPMVRVRGVAGAIPFAERILAAHPGDPEALRWMLSLRMSDKPAAAELARRLLAMSDLPTQTRVDAATVLASAGFRDEAIDVLETLFRADNQIDPRSGAPLASLFLEAGQFSAAMRTARSLVRAGQIAWLPGFCERLDKAGRSADAVRLLRFALATKTAGDWERTLRFQIVRILARAGVQPELAARERRMLKALISANPRALFEYYDLPMPAGLPDATAEAATDWADGDGGFAAGVWLADNQLAAADSIPNLDRVLSYPDDDEVCLARLAAALEREGRLEIALPLLDRLILKGPWNSGYHMQKARILSALGRSAESAEVLDQLALRRGFFPDGLFDLARFCETSGRADETRRYYNLALEFMPLAKRGQIALAYAAYLAADGEPGLARRALVFGYRYPGARDPAPLARALVADSAENDWETDAAACGLDDAMKEKLGRAVWTELQVRRPGDAAAWSAKFPGIAAD